MYKLSSSIVTYRAAGIFSLFSILQFFIGQQFFTDTGTSDLHHFFSAIPYISIIAIPAITLLLPFKNDELEYPIHTIFLVLGKLLVTVTILASALLLTIVVPISVSFFGQPEISQILCGYVGML